MKNYTTSIGLSGLVLIMICWSTDVHAQRRYRHIKKARTEEGFVQKIKPAEKRTAENETLIPIRETYTAEPAIIVPEPLSAESEEPSVSMEMASADNTLTTTPQKRVKFKKNPQEKPSIGKAERQLYSNKALTSSGLNKMANPEKTQGRPGLAFIIMGSIFMAIGLILLISGIYLTILGSFFGFGGLFVVLIVFGVILLILGSVFLPIGIARLVKYKRGS